MDDETDGFEIEHGHAEYSDAELLELAQCNLQALTIATGAFLRDRGIPFAAWVEATGRTLARAWDEPRPWSAAEFMDAMLTNLRAVGAEVVSVDLGEERAEAVTTGYPDPELCAQFGVAAGDVAGFIDVAAPIARERGLSWTWTVDGEQTRYLVERSDRQQDSG